MQQDAVTDGGDLVALDHGAVDGRAYRHAAAAEAGNAVAGDLAVGQGWPGGVERPQHYAVLSPGRWAEEPDIVLQNAQTVGAG